MKEGWTQKMITEVAWFQEGPGVRNTQYTDSGVKLLNVANLVDGKVDLSTSKRYISENEAYGKYRHFLVDDGDFIIASSGIQVEYIDKKMGFINKSHLPLCMNTSTIRFKPIDSKVLNMRFFMYYLKSQDFKNQLARQITGIAQLNYGPSHLKRMYIPMTGITEQQRIVAELDLLTDIIEKQKTQLKELDTLAQSIFYDMFGDPIINDKQWDVSTINDTCTITCGQDYKNVIDSNGEYPIYGTGGIMGRAKQYRCPKNSVIIGRKGNINNPILVLEDFWNVDTAFGVTPNDTILSPFYFFFFCKHYDFTKHDVSVTIPSLRRTDVLKISFPVPPVSLQKSFAQKIQSIESQKASVNLSIAETQKLFDYTMDKYFG